MAHVTTDGRITKIDGLVIEDSALATLLAANDEGDWTRLVERAVAVGAHGLLTMGVDVGLGAVRDQVRREVEEATRLAEARVAAMLEAAEQAYREHLDPELRSSLLSRSLREFHQWQAAFFSSMDVDQAGSLGERLVGRLEALVGRGGALEAQLAGALDPSADGSALATVRDAVLGEIRELRDAVHTDRGRQTEAERGTRKGFAYEDQIEERTRTWAAGVGGCIVERTSTDGGALGREALVGDVVVTLPDGCRVVIEAKHAARLSLGGSGILAELDRAMSNRGADVAICVSATEAFPAEVGTFAIYGNRILVVDEGTDTLLDVALRVAMLLATTARPADDVTIDRAALLDQLERIHQLAKRFSTTKRTLTEAQNGIELAKQGIDALRAELVELAEAATHEVRSGG
jgi:hypothetical protein